MLKVNENVVAALKAAANEAGQPIEIAQRLVAWLDALATGGTAITDNSAATDRISDLLDLVQLPSDTADEDDLSGEDDA